MTEKGTGVVLDGYQTQNTLSAKAAESSSVMLNEGL